MTEPKKPDAGAKGWHIVESRWHYFFAGLSFCGNVKLTAEAANAPYLGPRHVGECKVCMDTVNKKRL